MAVTALTIITSVFIAQWGFCASESSRIKCSEDVMRIEIPTSKPMRKIYLDGLEEYPDKHCRPVYDTQNHVYTFELSLKDVYQCGVTRVSNQITGQRMYYHRVVMEDDGNLNAKEILNVKCVIKPIVKYNHTLVRRNVLPIDFQEPEDLAITSTLLQRAPEPVLGVNVKQGGQPLTGGQLHVAPGTPLQMEIYLDQQSAPIYGLLVAHLQVTDTGTQEETMIYNGCSIDPYLFDNFRTDTGDNLIARFRAFKFPESTYVQFRATVNVCLDKCRGVECSNGVRGYGKRRRREISSMPADPNKVFEISITSFIKVSYDDESENFESYFNRTDDKHKKFITGKGKAPQMISATTFRDNGNSLVNKQLLSPHSANETKFNAITNDTTTNNARVNCAGFVILIAFLHRM